MMLICGLHERKKNVTEADYVYESFVRTKFAQSQKNMNGNHMNGTKPLIGKIYIIALIKIQI